MLFTSSLLCALSVLATVSAQVPSELSEAFDTTITLTPEYAGQKVADGDKVSVNDLTSPPTFDLTGAPDTTAKFTIILMDITGSPDPTTLGTLVYAQSGFSTKSSTGGILTQAGAAAVKYVAPTKNGNQLVFLLFTQQSESPSSLGGVGGDLTKFSLDQFREANLFELPDAGSSYVVDGTASSSSGNTQSSVAVQSKVTTEQVHSQATQAPATTTPKSTPPPVIVQSTPAPVVQSMPTPIMYSTTSQPQVFTPNVQTHRTGIIIESTMFPEQGTTSQPMMVSSSKMHIPSTTLIPTSTTIPIISTFKSTSADVTSTTTPSIAPTTKVPSLTTSTVPKSAASISAASSSALAPAASGAVGGRKLSAAEKMILLAEIAALLVYFA